MSNPFRCRLVICASVLLSASLAGCHASHLGSLNQLPGPTVVIVDRSVPGFQNREDQFQLIDSLAKSSYEANSEFDLWEYDSTAKHLFGPALIPTVDILDSYENNDLKYHAGPAHRQTRADTVISEFESTPGSRESSGRIFILTDGHIDNPAGNQALLTAVKSIGLHTQWRVAVLGITPPNQSAWQAIGSQAMPGRMDLVSMHNAVSLLTQNRDE